MSQVPSSPRRKLSGHPGCPAEWGSCAERSCRQGLSRLPCWLPFQMEELGSQTLAGQGLFPKGNPATCVAFDLDQILPQHSPFELRGGMIGPWVKRGRGSEQDGGSKVTRPREDWPHTPSMVLPHARCHPQRDIPLTWLWRRQWASDLVTDNQPSASLSAANLWTQGSVGAQCTGPGTGSHMGGLLWWLLCLTYRDKPAPSLAEARSGELGSPRPHKRRRQRVSHYPPPPGPLAPGSPS